MTVQEALDSISSINVWKRGDQRAPHKPLLLLLMIARYRKGGDRLVAYEEVESLLKQLLVDFGPTRKTYHPEQPFCHLHTDGFWQLVGVDGNPAKLKSASAKRSILIENHAQGGLTEEFYDLIRGSIGVDQIVAELLENHFPESMHAELLEAVGMESFQIVRRRPRDPEFRHAVLRAYESACAICGFSSRVAGSVIGVEAAHIKWHMAGGLDTESNGIALCPLHHKLFDRGVITIDPAHRVLVSEHATGTAMFEHLVKDFHGRELRPPLRTTYAPELESIAWHVREVFRPPAREMCLVGASDS